MNENIFILTTTQSVVGEAYLTPYTPGSALVTGV